MTDRVRRAVPGAIEVKVGCWIGLRSVFGKLFEKVNDRQHLLTGDTV
jgi:hypothetical protein